MKWKTFFIGTFFLFTSVKGEFKFPNSDLYIGPRNLRNNINNEDPHTKDKDFNSYLNGNLSDKDSQRLRGIQSNSFHKSIYFNPTIKNSIHLSKLCNWTYQRAKVNLFPVANSHVSSLHRVMPPISLYYPMVTCDMQHQNLFSEQLDISNLNKSWHPVVNNLCINNFNPLTFTI